MGGMSIKFEQGVEYDLTYNKGGMSIGSAFEQQGVEYVYYSSI
jgi:hypothetical protein